MAQTKKPQLKTKRAFLWVEIEPETRAAFVQCANQYAASLGLRRLGVGPWLAMLGRKAVMAAQEERKADLENSKVRR